MPNNPPFIQMVSNDKGTMPACIMLAKWYCVVNTSKLYTVLLCTQYCYLHSLSIIHKQTVVKWYCVVNASTCKLYIALLSTQLIYPPFINRQLSGFK